MLQKNVFQTLICVFIFCALFQNPVRMDADYVCTLDERTLEKAKEELNEDPKERLSQIQTLRTWIEQQPHLRCPTGLYPDFKCITPLHPDTRCPTSVYPDSRCPTDLQPGNSIDIQLVCIQIIGVQLACIHIPGAPLVNVHT